MIISLRLTPISLRVFLSVTVNPRRQASIGEICCRIARRSYDPVVFGESLATATYKLRIKK